MTNLHPEWSQLDRIEAMLKQLTAPKKPVKKATAKHEYPEQFEYVWDMYPKRGGGNPKRSAYGSWKQRLADTDDTGSMIHALADGVTRYKAYCDATGVTGTAYVLHAATFFGPNERYKEDWTIPKKDDTLSRNGLPEVKSASFKTVDFDEPAYVVPGIANDYSDNKLE